MRETKREIKNLKRNIIIHSATGMGYRGNVLKEIVNLDRDLLLDVITELNFTEINRPNYEIENILITECIRRMKYSDFREIQKHFIG